MTEPIRLRRRVETAPDAAFELFTRRLHEWWPSDYTWSGDALARIEIEARPGGRCLEVDEDATPRVWGTVSEARPGQRLVFRWQIRPDRGFEPDSRKASEVVVDFERGDEALVTEVRLEHRDFEQHGEGADAYREGLASERGWPLLLERFAEACAREGTG